MKVRIRLSVRVIVLVLGTVFLVIFFAARSVNTQFRTSIVDITSKNNEALLNNVATAITNLSDDGVSKLLALRSVVESMTDGDYYSNEDLYKKLIKNFTESDKNQISSWLSFDNQFVSDDEDEGRQIITAENQAFGTEVRSTSVSSYNDNLESPYYICKEAEAPIVDEPDYYNMNGSSTERVMKMTIAVPIMRNGSVVGVLGSNLRLDGLQVYIDSLNSTAGQNIMVVSAGGRMVAYPNSELSGQLLSDIDSVLYGHISTIDSSASFIISSHTNADSSYVELRPVIPGNLNQQWKLIAYTLAVDIDAGIHNTLTFMSRVILIGILILAIIVFIFSINIVRPIKKVNVIINKLSLGQVDESLKMNVETNDELGQMTDSSNKLVDGLLQITEFAENIGAGKSDYHFTPLSDRDILGNAIIEMKNSLDRASEEERLRRIEEEHRNWASNGINLFNKVLRVDNDNMGNLAAEIIKTLTLYVDAQMGAMYVVPGDKEGVEMVAHIGFDKSKADQQFIAPGDGLIGRSYLEKETIFISEIPADMNKIGSGLGSSLPKSALVVPLINNKNLVGIIELYSLKVFEPYQISFVEKLSENIASTISTVNINGQTATLLETSKKQSEVLEQQEEEIRQNMEEMQATQEESTQKELELTSIIETLFNTLPVVRFDNMRSIIDVSDQFVTMMHTQREKMVGKRHKADTFMNEEDQEKLDQFWTELLSGKIMEMEETMTIGKSQESVLERFIPVFGDGDVVEEVIAVYINITDQRKIENQIQMVQEGTIPDELTENIDTTNFVQRQIDLTNLNIMYKNDGKKISTILKRYQEQIPNQLEEFESTIKHRNYKVLKIEAKALQTKVNYLGIKSIYDLLDTIINMLSDDADLTRIPEIFDTIKENWNTAYSELSEILESLNA